MVVELVGHDNPACLDIALDLETTSHRLVVVHAYPTGLDVRFDFHACPSPFGL